VAAIGLIAEGPEKRRLETLAATCGAVMTTSAADDSERRRVELQRHRQRRI
jgi:hypothetical protein